MMSPGIHLPRSSPVVKQAVRISWPRRTVFWLCLMLLVAGWLPLSAALAAQDLAPLRPIQPDYFFLQASLEQVVSAEKKRLADIIEEKEELEQSRQSFQDWLHAYNIRLAAFRNVMALSGYDEHETRQALLKLQASLNNLHGRQKEINEAITRLEQRQQSIQERQQSYEHEKTTLRAQPAREEPFNSLLREDTRIVLDLLGSQKKGISDLLAIYRKRLANLETVLKSYQSVNDQFEERISRWSRRWLLEKESNPLSRFDVNRLNSEISRLTGKIKSLTGAFNLRAHTVPDYPQYRLFVVTYLLLFMALLTGLIFYHRYFRRLRDVAWEKGFFWQYLTSRMIRRSLLLAGAILFIHFYPVPPEYQITPFFYLMTLVKYLLLITLPVRWGLNFIRVMRFKDESLFFVFPGFYLKVMLYGLFLLGGGYTVLAWGLGETALAAVLWRLAMEVALLLWSFVFWERFSHQPPPAVQTIPGWWPAIKPVLPVMSYLLVLFGLFCELLGFGGLAAFWFRSWIQTIALVLWVGILFMLIKEVDTSLITPLSDEAIEEDLDDEDDEKPTPLKWLLIRLAKIVLLIVTIAALLAAWGGRKAMLLETLGAVNYELTVGKFNISLLDIIAAILFILVVQTMASLLKQTLKEKVLARRKVEPGLQESIVTITGYLIWLIGLFIVLRIIGISAASLTVLFGAIGIGLGFGLQNIFNNFVSGIILLFERPIKVGDVIEINGLWGTVKKINVRSTQVRTFDNADLIIPNTDFINQQLTNWSFKDARVRRNIVVGVAYGSDTVLVKETLFDIAYHHPQVYKRPHPEVLFEDFGESALIFKLRLWASINYFLSVETDVRFEIDRRFRELGITIPFPQRDVYIRGTGGTAASTEPKTSPAKSGPGSGTGQPEPGQGPDMGTSPDGDASGD